MLLPGARRYELHKVIHRRIHGVKAKKKGTATTGTRSRRCYWVLQCCRHVALRLFSNLRRGQESSLSPGTGTELVSASYGLDHDEEWNRCERLTCKGCQAVCAVFEKTVAEKVASMCCVDASCLCDPRTIAASGYGISGFKGVVQWWVTNLE